MKYVIFDLEATCWDQHDRSDNETIEIGAVLIDKKKNILKEFEQFVKPIKYPKLSPFCTALTTIQQSDVDNAPYFYEAKDRFLDWIDDEEYVLCSWGFYDRLQLESDCRIHSIPDEWTQSHISLKHQYGEFKNLRRALGMKLALEHESIELEGRHHRGIDDARNIAKIFLRYYEEWDFRKQR